MKLIFLGTGTSQGVPVITCKCPVCSSSDAKDKRLRTAVALQDKDFFVVIDTGPDFRMQMLRAEAERLDGVVFTHPHKDHTAGFDDIRPFFFKQQKPMEVFLNDLTLKQLKKEFSYIFDGTKYPGIPEVNIHLIEEFKEFEIKEITFLPILGFHYKLPVLGFRIGNLAYLTDMNCIPPRSMELLQDLDVLVINALRRREHISHFTLEGALQIVEELKPKKAFFTHFSHEIGLHSELEKELPEGVFPAYDGLEVYFEV